MKSGTGGISRVLVLPGLARFEGVVSATWQPELDGTVCAVDDRVLERGFAGVSLRSQIPAYQGKLVPDDRRVRYLEHFHREANFCFTRPINCDSARSASTSSLFPA